MTEKERIESHRKAVKKHNSENVYQFKCAFNKNTDKKIIDHLQKQNNKQGYIKTLILNDMEGGHTMIDYIKEGDLLTSEKRDAVKVIQKHSSGFYVHDMVYNDDIQDYEAAPGSDYLLTFAELSRDFKEA